MGILRPPKEDCCWVRYRVVKPQQFLTNCIDKTLWHGLHRPTAEELGGYMWIGARLAKFWEYTVLIPDWHRPIERGEIVRWRWWHWFSRVFDVVRRRR